MRTPLLFGALFVAVLTAYAAADYSINWSAVSSQGSRVESTTFQLDGLSGQPAAGLTYGSSGVLNAGFWAGNYGCTVNLTDLAAFAEVWLGDPQTFGFNLDDFSILASQWLCQCPAEWPLK